MHSIKCNQKSCQNLTSKEHNLIIIFFCITGPSLPYGIFFSAIAESPDGRGVILFGGQNSKTILELRAGADSWNILNVTLKNARKNHVVIPLS